MKVSLLTPLIMAAVASAQQTLQYVWVNGVDQGRGVGIRVPNNNPITDVSSENLTCNVGGTTGSGTATLNVPIGGTLTFEWHQHSARNGEDPLGPSHKGPVLVYIAKAPGSVSSFDGKGSVWTKIFEWGLVNPSSNEWATDVVNTQGGKHTVALPYSLPAGEYLVRAEQIALDRASSYPGAQFYVACVQINLTSGSSGATLPTVALPGAYKSSDPGITVDIHNNLKNYTIPGPAVWSGL